MYCVKNRLNGLMDWTLALCIEYEKQIEYFLIFCHESYAKYVKFESPKFTYSVHIKMRSNDLHLRIQQSNFQLCQPTNHNEMPMWYLHFKWTNKMPCFHISIASGCSIQLTLEREKLILSFYIPLGNMSFVCYMCNTCVLVYYTKCNSNTVIMCRTHVIHMFHICNTGIKPTHV